MVGFDACFVGCYSFDGNGALVVGEEACVGWAVREKYHGDDTPGYRYCAEDDEDVHYETLRVSVRSKMAGKESSSGSTIPFE